MRHASTIIQGIFAWLGAGLFLAVVTAVGIGLYYEHEKHQAIVKTIEIIQECKRTAPDELPNDAWGNPLKVVKDEGVWERTYIVSSGPDGKFGTRDDITRTVEAKFHPDVLGEYVGEDGTEFGIGVLKGAKNAMKKRIKKDKVQHDETSHQ